VIKLFVILLFISYFPSFRSFSILISVSRVAEPGGVVLTAEPEVVFEPGVPFEPQGIFEPEAAFEPRGIFGPGVAFEPQEIFGSGVAFEPQGIFEPEVVFEPRDIFEPGVAFEPQGIFGPRIAFELEDIFEPEGVFVVSPDVAGPQAAVDIAIPFAVLVPASGGAIEDDNSGRPKFRAFPNVDHDASHSSSGEAVGKEFVRSPNGAHTNYGLCSTLSSLGAHQIKNWDTAIITPIPVIII